MRFFKLQASGNDFICVLEEDCPATTTTARATLARQICERHFSIGADGFIVLKKISASELSWDFYNSDGSVAEMCGNASRVVALFFTQYMGGQLPASLHTTGGITLLNAYEDRFCIRMPKTDFLGEDGESSLWDTGVPHAVLHYDFISNLGGARDLARLYRYPKTMSERGANVSFWYEKEDGCHAVSFERGLEDFSLACGTGAAACALDILRRNNSGLRSVSLQLPGGSVELQCVDGSLFLIGDARVIYRGELL